ncbi:MAG: protein kinase [Planctomycetales bacterium]
MTDSSSNQRDSTSFAKLADRLCEEFETAGKSGDAPRVEDYLKNCEEPDRSMLLRELLLVEFEHRRRQGESVAPDEYRRRFPNHSQIVNQAFMKSGLEETLDSQHGVDETSDVPPEETLGQQSPPLPGVEIQGKLIHSLGDYDLLAELGQGGMGQVFKARHRRMKRTVALKVLSPKAVGNAGSLARFHQEVEAAARLTHPNVVIAHDASEDQGVHYFVMEYVPGCDLAELVKQDGPLPLNEALDCVIQAGKGLDYAHGKSIIHRDVKPANLLLDEEGVVKILDMGLARIESDEEGHVDLTASGAVMGTASYMSPEQAMNTKNADQRSDVYSLGCTLYYLLAGQSTFHGTTAMEMLVAHRENPIPDLGDARDDLPSSLQTVFAAMLAKKPADRYQSMAEVIADLEAVKDGKTVEPRTPQAKDDPTPTAEEKPSSESPTVEEAPVEETPVETPKVEEIPTEPPTVEGTPTESPTIEEVPTLAETPKVEEVPTESLEVAETPTEAPKVETPTPAIEETPTSPPLVVDVPTTTSEVKIPREPSAPRKSDVPQPQPAKTGHLGLIIGACVLAVIVILFLFYLGGAIF